jgi:hypothetical protein
MPDTKITALTAISTVDPAVDVLPIVDVSDTTMAASGTTKKVTLNNLLACSPTATLASATITGDLTVDTSTLKVDSTNNRVGVLTASPTHTLDVRGIIKSNGTYTAYVNPSFTGAAAIQTESAESLILAPSGQESLRCAPSGVYTFGDGAGGTRMTLNSTGLGVGRTPAYKLDIGGTGTQTLRIQTTTSGDPTLYFEASGADGSVIAYDRTNGGMRFDVSSITGAMRISTTGNVGVGVTPSAWIAGSKAVQIGTQSAFADLFGDAYVTQNCYHATAGWTYLTNAPASNYYQRLGSHVWRTVTAGTGLITTWTQAMTLDASGNLLVGTTSVIGGKLGIQAQGGNGVAYLLRHSSATAGKYRIFAIDSTNNGLFYDQNNVGMYMADGGTSWVATSDETKKDIIEPISNAVSKIGSLRSVIGKFKTDSEGTRRSFLIAQDVQSVLPEAIHNKDGELGLSYTDVIPLLVAAIKELTARVEALEA